MLRILSLLMLVVSLGACATGGGNAKFNTDLGMSALAGGDYLGAIRYLQLATEDAPDDPELWNALGLAFQGRGLPERAMDAYRKAIALKPDFSEAWNNLGTVYLSLSQFDSALEAFRKALENIFYPRPENAWFNIGLAYYNTGRYDEAVQAFDRSIRANPNFCDAYYHKGQAYSQKSRWREAADTFRSLIQICPETAEPYRSAGIAYLKLGKRETARQYFEKARELAGTGPLADEINRYLKLLR